jgi:macrolide transport system ATP-binding/permease protein
VTFDRIKRRWRALFRKDDLERELDDELRFHLERDAAQNLQSGMNPEEARYAALRAFGGVEQSREECRDARGVRMLEEFLQDLRYSTRMLLKRPGFTLIAILTLALGIGANTAILSTVNGFILRPQPVENPEELVASFWGSKKDAEVWGGFSYANYVDLRERNQSLSGMLVWSLTSAGVSGGASGDRSRAEVAWGELVSANYFDVLGVKPVLGRGFLPEEERTQNTHPVVVISHSLWRQRFNGDAAIIGMTLYLNGAPFTVVGVAPATFKGLKFMFHQAFWVPLMMSATLGTGGDWETERGWARFNLLGRLKPSVTVAQAEADFNRIAEALAQQYPKSNADTKVQIVSERDARILDGTKAFRLGALLALCVASLVLLVACANVANLLLARSAARAKEIGIRLALGAGRWRIVRQLLIVSLLLALLGGGLGWLFAYWGTALVHASIPPIPFPIDLDFSPDWYVLKWMVAVTLATVVIFGLVPALAASRPDLVAVIKNAAAGELHSKRRWNLRSVLVVAQVAISIVVLICAGLFLRSLNKAEKLDPGFSTENLVTMKLDPGLLAYDEAAGKRFYAETLRRVAALPGVRAASLAAFLPLGDSNGVVGPVMKEGEPEPLPNQRIDVSSNWVGPGYFATVKTPLVMGRDFTERDTQGAPLVVIVNQEFARKFYGSEQNALGKRFRFWTSKAPLREITGIAKNGLYLNLYEDPRPYIYLPEYQLYQSGMMLLVSANKARDLPAIAESVRREITQLDARLPVSGLTLAEANMSFAYWVPRVMAGVAAAFGLLALLLATMGLYSVMTYTVSQRTREMGIRMALGAQSRNVLQLVIRQGMSLVVIGLCIGLVGAIALTRVIATLLLGVGAKDPLTFVAGAALLSIVAFVACYIPGRRATRVDPLTALRYE